ncbi:MAG: substrate-binding domain-containing protein [Clostridia bacterium]|nr:substrate-binding domain-containing protein [Clostridia bacterium]
MDNNRKYIGFLMILPLLFLLFGCGHVDNSQNESNGTETPNKGTGQVVQVDNQIKIGLSLGTLAEERWMNEKLYFEAEAMKYGAQVIAKDANKNENIQREQVLELINEKVDVLVIVAVNAKTASCCVEAAKKAGVPVLAYSRMINNAEVDTFIGFDVIAIGETLAKAALEKVPRGNYMIINGASIDNNAKLEQEGYHKVLKPYIDKGLVKVVFEEWCENWSPEAAEAAVKKGLEKCNNRVDAILVSNDGMAGGVVNALNKEGLTGKVFITGTDGDLSALQRIAAGTQTVTLLFPQKEFAEEGARAAISLANGMVPADATGKTFNGIKGIPTIFAKTVLVTKDNLNEVIVRSGLQKAEDVYKYIPREKWPK